jgi:hypothetical protein
MSARPKPFDLAEARAWVEKNERKDHIWTGPGAWKWLRLALAEIERVQGPVPGGVHQEQLL